MFSKQVPLKRYTPPTCTLEIWAKNRTELWSITNSSDRELRFELYFDDPRLSEEEQVTIGGKQSELELLSEVVINYVHHFLAQSMNRQNQGFSPLKKTRKVSSKNSPVIANQGLLSHQLLFGNLDASKPAVTLSASQLFDLLDALEQYQEEVQTLFNPSSQTKRKSSIIALLSGVILALSALSLYLWRGLDPKSNFGSQIAQENRSNRPPINLLPVTPPLSSPKRRLPVPSPLISSDLAKRQTLKTPSVVVVPSISPSPTNSLQPNPNNPVIQVYPSSTPNKALPPVTTAVEPSENSQSLEIEPKSLKNNSTSSSRDVLVAPPLVPLDRTEPKPSSLLDTIPQVQEAREYFEQRWKVPNGLTQTLEYRLQINPQGSISQITPLGRSASIYLDRTSMPLLNEPFVSPLTNQETATIRLVLLPDGKVKTFLE